MSRAPLVGLAGLALAVGLSGCIGGADREAEPGRLALTASWRDGTHLDVTVENVGGSPMSVGGMDTMRLTGPQGSMPIRWSGMAPTLAPGESRTFDLHAIRMADGTMGMAMDHMIAGDHAPMPMGDYVLRVGDAAAAAPLGR